MAYSSNLGTDDAYADAAPMADKPKMDDGHQEEGETTVIPESMLMGKHFDVGEEVIFRIVSKHDGEVEITYATQEGKDKEESDKEPQGRSPAAEPQMAAGGGGDEMASMMY